MHVQSIGCSVEGGETSAATSLGAQGRERTDILSSPEELKVRGRSRDGLGKGEAWPGRGRPLGAWPGRGRELDGGEAVGGVAWAWPGAERKGGPRGRGLGAGWERNGGEALGGVAWEGQGRVLAPGHGRSQTGGV